jgi:hypothetical protein
MTETSVPPIRSCDADRDVQVTAQRRRPNVIILTSGITGSSVLSGFLARSGYWSGDTTHKKEYDTFENSELIRLNLQIFQQAGYTGNYVNEFSTDALGDHLKTGHQ